MRAAHLPCVSRVCGGVTQTGLWESWGTPAMALFSGQGVCVTVSILSAQRCAGPESV
jgi:hypothetical protein